MTFDNVWPTFDNIMSWLTFDIRFIWQLQGMLEVGHFDPVVVGDEEAGRSQITVHNTLRVAKLYSL